MKCVICLGIIQATDAIACPNCSQEFHQAHLAAWVKVDNSCPFCTERFEKQFVKQITPYAHTHSIDDQLIETARIRLLGKKVDSKAMIQPSDSKNRKNFILLAIGLITILGGVIYQSLSPIGQLVVGFFSLGILGVFAIGGMPIGYYVVIFIIFAFIPYQALIELGTHYGQQSDESTMILGFLLIFFPILLFLLFGILGMIANAVVKVVVYQFLFDLIKGEKTES
ncbi:MAG: RING finger protein [Candidatus Kariarchaeaceae archaeon]|jgi:hypothetical protein